ncbi:MAG: LysR substrate-binding domain-containing protein [Ekhidna sp.]
MNYTLHQLRIFLKVSELQSITKASEELHLTQPAVSIQLKKLQDQFELPLTEVIGRQLYVTDFGKHIAEASKRILFEADNMRYTINQFKGIITGEIKISVVSTGKYVIPYFLKPFMDKYPGVEISIDVSNKKEVVEKLVKNENDFSLVSVLPDGMNLHAVELMENRLFLVGNSQDPHPPKKIGDISKLTLLYREEGSATRKAMQEYLDSHGIVPKKSMKLVSNEAVKQAINAGIGYSIMPLIGLRNELANKSMVIYTLKDLPIVTNWNLVYNKGKNLTPAQSELIKFIEENKETISSDHFNWAVK